MILRGICVNIEAMKVKDISALIESIAPLQFQENYDNAGLIVGHPDDEITGVMLSLDVTEQVIDEAVRNNCNLVLAHHPIVFNGLKRLNGSNYVERTVIQAIKKGVAIYAAHTNLDNVLMNGVNQKFASKLGLQLLKILQPKVGMLSKIQVYVPVSHLDIVKEAMFEAGAGRIGNYSECGFEVEGLGSFKPGTEAEPYSGTIGVRENAQEIKFEVLVHNHQVGRVMKAMKAVHPYEEVAHEIIGLSNEDSHTGSGIIGELANEMTEMEFLALLKEKLSLKSIRHTSTGKKIRKVALCGGSGSFLIGAARRAGADAYVTGDIKYHEYFDAENDLTLCDVGHYESEISTLEIFYDKIKEKLPNFAVIFCQLTTNPIHYYQ